MGFRWLSIAVLVLLGGCGSGPAARFEFTRLCMGVQTRIVLYAPDRDRAEAGAAAAFHRIEELDSALSDYRPASDLSRVNGAAGGGAVRVSPDLIFMLERCAEIADASGGAFDCTIGPATQLWRRMRGEGRLAPGPEIDAARGLVNWREVEIDTARGTARLARAGMRLDLGGIAKGHAAEEGARMLRQLGFPRCLVALSGDVFAGEPPPGERGWRVTLAGERGSPRPEPRVVLLRNAAVSTAGDAEQRLVLEGRQMSHIIDPKSGLGSPLCRSVSVIAPHGWQADGLDTAAYLMGAEASRGMLERFGAAAVFDDAGSGREVVGAVEWVR